MREESIEACARAAHFVANAAGTSNMFGGVTRGVSSYRSGGGYKQ